MKKIVLVTAIWLSGLLTCMSQLPTPNKEEIVKQKETQRKYLLKQIAVLRNYLGFVKKGYDIARKGLSTIHRIKNGDFNLHDDFFRSLQTVRPAIAKYGRIADISATHIDLIKITRHSIRTARQSGQFTASEIAYLQKIVNALVQSSQGQLEALLLFTSSNKLQLKDDERLSGIDAIHNESQDLLDFAKSLATDLFKIALQRKKESREVITLQQLYQIR
jgi:hypothetical protein